MRWRRFGQLNGSMVGELTAMKREAPESLYTMLRDEQFTLVDILKLNLALKQISSPVPRLKLNLALKQISSPVPSLKLNLALKQISSPVPSLKLNLAVKQIS